MSTSASAFQNTKRQFVGMFDTSKAKHVNFAKRIKHSELSRNIVFDILVLDNPKYETWPYASQTVALISASILLEF